MMKVNIPIQKEIIRYQEQLNIFRISIQHLPANMPTDNSTRAWCRDVALKLAETQSLVDHVFKSKKLPYRKLAKQFLYRISSLKRHSNYILALFLLKHGDYQLLHKHLKVIL
ncbi:hypothetical protein JI666_16520 [Bacillus sp. NTK071]|uniref:hypothetical protein n=1 Tax=Bacillus sp. NTK071 TaxID=2802175 RepID=UPI001A8CF098|nr:hypothetical protein [Bacillus sp. NTK071]MBN8210359.1 hypothetical protein [Bacillus sp. NTK071]